ncbi:transcriptional regulator [Clostridium sp. CCUG 7971]|uniref:transcriptional regulator n=1 Tax=Clostridium sp. CCUG 7971 TaxID=2811414 RepID=UPI001ABB454D|nr:transcriptional regulator [Clostridium sp. CCUG 7971]MBO3444415.1 transcriptional regulator [Clostridium sp. CCUG 7971]
MIVGVIGPSDSSQKICEYLHQLDREIEIKLYIGERVVDTLDKISICEKECDVIIFTGCGVSEAVKSKHEVKKPNGFVSRGGTSILKAFWEVKNDNMKLDRFSIDVVENEILEDILQEVDINHKEIFSLPFSNEIDEMEYAKWHINLYKQNKISVILTGFAGVYNEIKRQGYPVYRLHVTRPLIKVCYEKVKSEFELNKAQYSQIAVEVLSLADYKSNNENYYSNMIKKSEMDKFIVEYVRSIQGSLFNFGRDEYIVFAHKGAVKNVDNYNKLFKLQKDIKNIGFSLGVGIGIGVTAYQAEANGYKALKRCKDSDEFYIYSVDENDFIKGPLGLDNELNYSLVSSNEKVMDIATRTGLSCESVAKLMAINEIRQSKIYDTKELANYLDISDRSSRRILNKIVSADLGRICAKESSKGGGRPKNLIEVLF